MAATTGLTPYKPNAPIETEDGTWVAIATAWPEEFVQVLLPYPSENEPQPEVSVWWDGSASPRAVRDWVAETMHVLHGPALECRVEVWADEAPEEPRSYRLENVGGIAEHIQKWADDGAVGCSIEEGPQKHGLFYMWAELNGPDAQTHHGEVGLRYATEALETGAAKPVFSSLLVHTAFRHFPDEEIERVYYLIRNNVLSIANARLLQSEQP